MKRIILVLVMATVTNSLMAKDTTSFDQFQKDLAYFYQAPSKAKFEHIQQAALKYHDKIPKHNRLITIVWTDKVAKQYHWKPLENFYPKAIGSLRDEKSKMAQFVYDNKSVNPQKLDIWWASFFATGKSDYVHLIFEQAIQPDNKQNPNNALIKGAAKWSFNSNCKQHAKIRDFARDWLTNKDLNKSSQALLNQCVVNKPN